MRIVPPVFPWRGLRGVDAWGAGTYGAPRDGGSRTHPGLDFISVAGDAGIAVFDGVVSHLGWPYPWTRDLHLIYLDGRGEWAHYKAEMMYVQSDLKLGTEVKQGQQIGVCEPVAEVWAQHLPERKGTMTNHLHLGIRVNGIHGESTHVNPGHYFDEPRVA